MKKEYRVKNRMVGLYSLLPISSIDNSFIHSSIVHLK